MNSSLLSVYDNVNTTEKISKSSVYGALNDLLNINADPEVRIYCPLCVNSFSFKFSLFEHLRRFHNNFLAQAGDQTLKFKECPFCDAKFYGTHLTAKHVLYHHHKVVKKLFVIKNKFKCVFCNVKLSKETCSDNVKHIESLHFLDFVEEFRKMFLSDTLQEMTISDFVNSAAKDPNPQGANRSDLNMTTGNTPEAEVKDFNEASKVNCYDFTDLKQQLDNLKLVQTAGKPELNSVNKSILRDIRNSNVQKSARRVLRFDLPCDDEDKENSPFSQGCNLKPINADEYSLLCSDSKFEKAFTCNFTTCGEPQHCSTPNFKISRSPEKDGRKGNTHESNLKCDRIKKTRSKMKFHEKKAEEFEFQCGKCRLLFRENFELVCHVKNSHKKFSLNAFQPGYHCAICDARFYKNRYLKKHHNLHKPY